MTKRASLETIGRGERIDHFETIARAEEWRTNLSIVDGFPGQR